jgi:hypothetical protein
VGDPTSFFKVHYPGLVIYLNHNPGPITAWNIIGSTRKHSAAIRPANATRTVILKVTPTTIEQDDKEKEEKRWAK